MNKMSLCEANFNFKEYNLKTKKVVCECNINNRSILNLEDIINKEKLLNNFIDLKSTSNLLVMKYYNLLFSKDIFFKNIGNYILISIIIMNIIGIIFFYIKEYPSKYIKITNIIENKKNKKENEENKGKKIFHKDDISKNPINYKGNANALEDIQSNENLSNYSELNNNKNNTNSQNQIMDCEINRFTYKEAVEKDKRQMIDYYISLIKTK